MAAKLILIVGPTASGKSALAMQVAKDLDGEIVCADSQTIRRDMNIGTAKPSPEDQKQVRHHLLDIVGPYDDYSVAHYKADAKKVIEEIQLRGKTPIIVGGTGLYIDALYFDYAFDSGVPADPEVRRVLSGNPRHVTSGASPKQVPIGNSLIVGLLPPREDLLIRIKNRIDLNFEHGFMNEVQEIIKKYGAPPRMFDAIAYRYAYEYICGLRDLTETKELIFIAERQYAKRQVTWFKRNPHIHWFEDPAAAYEFVQSQIKA